MAQSILHYLLPQKNKIMVKKLLRISAYEKTSECTIIHDTKKYRQDWFRNIERYFL